jgi:hypothetical protein
MYSRIQAISGTVPVDIQAYKAPHPAGKRELGSDGQAVGGGQQTLSLYA